MADRAQLMTLNGPDLEQRLSTAAKNTAHGSPIVRALWAYLDEVECVVVRRQQTNEIGRYYVRSNLVVTP